GLCASRRSSTIISRSIRAESGCKDAAHAGASRWATRFASWSRVWTCRRESVTWRWKRNPNIPANAERESNDAAQTGAAPHRASQETTSRCAPQHARGRHGGAGDSSYRDRESEHLRERRVLHLAQLPRAAVQGGAHDRAPAVAGGAGIEGAD